MSGTKERGRRKEEEKEEREEALVGIVVSSPNFN